jgi:hypothetical protein
VRHFAVATTRRWHRLIGGPYFHSIRVGWTISEVCCNNPSSCRRRRRFSMRVAVLLYTWGILAGCQ